MPTTSAFRLSLYLALAFACVAIGYAESPLLIESPIIAGIVLVALIALYLLETRVELLTIPAANRLGLALGLANLVWAVFRILRELNNPQMLQTDWPVLGLALIGPLVMTLMPAKLARREKHAGDYWWLHGLGLAAAALAGAMADDLFAFLFIGAYAICATWSLSIFALLRAAGRIQPIPGQAETIRVAGVVSDDRRRIGMSASLKLIAFALLIATPLYLLTPRSTFEKLEFGKSRVEIGYAADQMIDLTRTGDLKANEQLAFEVIVETASGPKTDLSPDQRWRGRVLRQYRSGSWHDGAGEYRLPYVEPIPAVVQSWSPPPLWSDQMLLTFFIPAGTRGRFLADPVAWRDHEPTPVASATSNGFRPWVWSGSGAFSPESRMRGTGEPPPQQYLQVWHTEKDSDLSPPLRLVDPDRENVLSLLSQNSVPKVKDYSDSLIDKMVREGLLPPMYYDRATLLPRRQFHDQIARAFTQHLATTPTLTYTTELRRERKDLDPIEDFLFYTRAGHCERFATALVLMLRSQGIPAVMVLGFKGCESTEEPGRYLVRQENAHAWVEAFIEEYEPIPWWGYRRNSRWLSLDPTPSGSPATTAGEGWVQRAGSWLRRLYNSYVLDYTPEQRARALTGVLRALTRIELLAALAVLVMGFFVWRRTVHRRAAMTAASAVAPWFDRLLAVLAVNGIIPEPGETPRELALRAADALRHQHFVSALAEVPLEWTEAYYEARFGGQTVMPDRALALDARLEELRVALTAAKTHGVPT